MIDKSCIVCDKELEHCFQPDGRHNVECIGTVADATIWRSHGNYGSSLYDSTSGGEFLEAYVCDECLKKKAHQVRAVEYQRTSVAMFDDSFEGMGARDEARSAVWAKRREEKLDQARRIVQARVESMGSMQAVKDFSQGEDAEAMTVRRAMRLLQVENFDFSGIEARLKSPENRAPDAFMS